MMSVRKQLRLGDSLNLNIGLCNTYEFTDRNSLLLDNYREIEGLYDKHINPIQDAELNRYTPFNTEENLNIETIQINLLDENGNQLFYSDFGFINDDIRLGLNNFIRSFIRLSNYSEIPMAGAELFGFTVIFTQVFEDQRNPDGMQPLDVSNMPITFKLRKPGSVPQENSEGYYLYWIRDIVNNPELSNLYTVLEFSNAKDGDVIKFIPSMQTEDYFYEKQRYITTRFFKDNNMFYYEYLSESEDGERDISFNTTNRTLTINFYKDIQGG